MDLGKIKGCIKMCGVIYYVKFDGSVIECKVFFFDIFNGIGLSFDEKILYVVDMSFGCFWSWEIGVLG